MTKPIGPELIIGPGFVVGGAGEGPPTPPETVPGGEQAVLEPEHHNPFTYLARDLLTWNPLDMLPYQGVGFGRVLDAAGAWKGSLPLVDERVQRFAWQDATRPSRTALFVDLHGTLVWGGIIWTANYDSSDPTHSLQVSAQEFGSYFARRLQAEDYATIWEAGEDPMKVVKRVIEDAQAAELAGPGYITGAKIPVVLNPAAGSGTKIAVSYPGSSLQTIDSIISTLVQLGFGAGFDVSYDVAYLPGTKTPGITINLWFPLKGRTAQQTGIVILARDTIKWTYTEDGTAQANEITETGAGSAQPITATSKLPSYPLLQKVQARSQVTSSELLEEAALGDIALAEYPVVSPSVVIPVGSTPAAERDELILGEFDVGDRLRFKIDPVGQSENTDPRFPAGMDYEFRINQWTCTPKDSGLSTLQLDLGMPPLGFVPAPTPPH